VNTAFRESFDADLSAITDRSLLLRIRKVIEQVESARTFLQIPNLKHLRPAASTIVSALGIIALASFSSAAR